jgi:hypothetical protein
VHRGGAAAAAAPLEDDPRALTTNAWPEGHTRLRSVDAYDILMHASDAVLSGGVRRSGHDLPLLAGGRRDGDRQDRQLVHSRTRKRARSNNSAVRLLRNQTPREQFHQVMKVGQRVRRAGLRLDRPPDMTFNPCGEIRSLSLIDGMSGFAFCNLCEINMGIVDDKEKFRTASPGRGDSSARCRPTTRFRLPRRGKYAHRQARGAGGHLDDRHDGISTRRVVRRRPAARDGHIYSRGSTPKWP